MVYLYYLSICFAPAGMSVVQVKNLQRRLDNLS